MEWLNYHHLYYFWVVCKEGGFSKAAIKLRISQSAVSLQISKLEDFLGEKLMDRGPRGFILTEAGQVTLSEAEQIFRQGHDLVQYFRSGKMKASFRIGALSGLSKNLQLKLLTPVLKEPSIELVLEVGDAKVLLERLVNYQLDGVLSDVPFTSSEAEPLTQTEVQSQPMCLVSKTKRNFKKVDTISGIKNGIYLPAKSSPVTSSIMDYLDSQKIQYNVKGFVDDIAFLRLLALETDSIIAIPKIGVQRDIDSKQLHVFHEFKNIRQKYFLIQRQKGKRHPMLSKIARN